jgi:hypothetical protein
LYINLLLASTRKNLNPMATSMLEYTKTILEKVSFDRKLFEKELRKALRYLMEPELRELERWCMERFGLRYRLVGV